MAITMYQSDRNFVSPANDASLYSGLSGDISGILNRGNSFNVTVDGLVATIDTGQAIIAGRLVEITIPETVTIPANSSGYICLVIDLTKHIYPEELAGIVTVSGMVISTKRPAIIA